MMHPGEPAFPYGPRYNKRGKMTAGRGFEDVFMSDSSFDSFLPMDDFRDLRINDSPFDAGHPFPGRFDELPPVRSMRDENPYFSSTRARNSPPDFMPNFQTAAKKPQINEGRPRRVQVQKSRMADGQISLRPVRDSIVAQPTSLGTRTGQVSSNQQRQTNGQATGINEKPKPSKKAPAAPKVDTDKLVVTIVEEFVKSRNVAETMKSIKDLNSSQTKVALIVKLLQTIMRENEEDQNLAGDLLKKCFDEKMLTKESLTKGIESYIRKLSKSDKESDIVKAALGKFSARLIVEDVLDLHTVNNAMEAVDLLFLQCLKDLKQLKGEDWLLELFNNSKVNLATTLA
ncbi:Eukaryotic translation initiation factor 4 gamma 2, partial [Paramuricea clavata]